MTESRRAAPARFHQKTDMLPVMARSCSRLAAKSAARALAVLLMWPLPAVAEATPAALPGSFSEQWCAYHTEHFELFTDLPHKRALRTIDGLNRFRQMFLRLFPAAPGDATLPLTMLVFARERDFTELTGTSRYAGVTLPSMHQYRLLAARGQRGAPTENAWHEYAHYLLRNRADRSYPLWYEEGLASYLGAADLHRNPVRLGKLPHRQMAAIANDQSVTFEATVEATSVLDLTDNTLVTFYGKAWLLTHFIRLGHQSGFADLRPALARYLNSTGRNFKSAFGLSPDAIAALLTEYLQQRRKPIETLRLPAVAFPVPERICLTPPERDYQLAVSIIPINRDVAIRVLEKLEPTAKRLTALSQAVWSDRDRARSLVDQALTLAPEDADANVQRAHLLVHGCSFASDAACIGNWAQAVTLYRAVLERNPRRFDAAYGLGVAYLHTGRAVQAMEYLRVAYEKLPWHVSINFYLGEGYRIAGDRRAGAHLNNARNWTRDEAWRQRAEFALQRLHDES